MTTMNAVDKYLLEFKPSAAEWLSNQGPKEQYEFFRDFFTPKRLKKANWADFQKIGEHLNCFAAMPLAKANALGRPNHPLKRYRESFEYLANGKDPVEERIRKFHGDDAYRLAYFGNSAVSELAGFLFPSEFVLFNARDQFAADFLKITPAFESTDDLVSKLTKFCDAVQPVAERYVQLVGRQTDVPLNLEIDQFFSWIYTKYSGKKDAPTRFWVIGAGDRASEWKEFYEHNFVAIGWDELGDLTAFESLEQLQKRLEKIWPTDAKQRNNSRTCWDFANELHPGDAIFVKDGVKKAVGLGVVESDYRFEADRSSYKHVRSVRWTWKGDFDLPHGLQLPLKTLTLLTNTDVLAALKKVATFTASATEEKNTQHWWINANPKIWNFSETPVGGRQVYTSHNERGNKRQKYKYFEEVKTGDWLIGYVTSPDRELVALARVTKALGPQAPDGTEGIEFEKVEQVANPIPLHELQKNPALQSCEPILSNQGSLFRLTSEEFAVIRSLIDDLNPLAPTSHSAFSKKDALKALFLSEEQLDEIAFSLQDKKNVILQGPPGVGKTYVAKKLAYLLMKEVDSARVQMVQFHQSYSYEDFIQGYRPSDDGHFELRNGHFFQFCRKAQRDPDKRPFIFIIDEINRGNLSKILGEVMMLIEPDKRGPEFAIPLAYSGSADETFFVPSNVFVIGLMNTADRSLAMVDYALRRRFRFIGLKPEFKSERFSGFLLQAGAKQPLIKKIVSRLSTLNDEISGDEKNLGPGYRIGHSFFCPMDGRAPDEVWYRAVINSEIKPLLDEYWLDDEDKVNSLIAALTE
ncbi:ATPase associated with various cellular activities, AAA_5 [Candidatus Koribacter versatilis Ellin345]|uniref:ATPase associated with various cellular activities, AAA_5 n=1 Tax=Koribacter versatilis (strain Ellin345) TaxID=204669 RepID=Q1IK46_KORVE|nr:AAA family ATPase [Candidatus Koribacter versatilis]ABF42754.1 ATPase associated with various cellular activities, AAA_5 [Candidatus Koribacter versatilis Ellin345]